MTIESIVDAHHHLWDPTRRAYPWMAGEAFSPIRRRYGRAELAGALANTAVTATVLVQTVSDRAETVEFLAEAARSEGLVVGVVGWLDLTADSVAEDLAALRSRPGGAGLVGIRHQVENEPDPDWLSRPDVRRGLRAVAEAGLAYDLLVRPDQLGAATEVVRAVPELRFVLDHGGKPPIRESGKPPIRESGKPPIRESGKPPIGESGKPPTGHSGKPATGHSGRAPMGESGRSPMGNSGGPPVEKSGEPPVEGSDRPWSGSGGPPPGDGSVGHSRHDGSTAGAVGGWAPSSGAARWSSAVGALAEAENVVCKLSGLITEASWSDWTVDDIRPYADRLLSTFGPRRLLYGSDWPVCELAGTYGEVLTLADRLTDALSVAERRRVLSTNAREWYRLRG